jgi:hypothetical protein
MGRVIRKVMQFLVPTSVNALRSNDLTDRSIVPVYVNPDTINIQETKIINENLTKGGYVIQYWGEELPVIQVSGTTASGGIEAINILRGVYRNEQIQFKNLLNVRAEDLAAVAEEGLFNTSLDFNPTNVLLDVATGGAFSTIVDGVSSTIEAVTNAALGNPESVEKIELIPSLAAFAISIDLFWQGEKFRGYFKTFSVDESSQKPGHFDYSFTFNVIRRSGSRKNFMPWHRNPNDISGEPVTASTPKEGIRIDELSFPTTQSFFSSRVSSSGKKNQSGDRQSSGGKRVPLNRNQSIKGK